MGLKKRCEELAVQPRGTRGESGGFDGCTYDVSNKHRLGYSEVQLIQVMIDGVNTLWKEDQELQKSMVCKLRLKISCHTSFVTLWAFSMFWTSSPKLSLCLWAPKLSSSYTMFFPQYRKDNFFLKKCWLAGKLFVTSFYGWRDILMQNMLSPSIE